MKFKEIKKYFVEEEGCEGVYCFDEDKLDNMTKKEIKEMFLSILEEYQDYSTDGDKEGTYIIVPVEGGELIFASKHDYSDELEEFGKKIDYIQFEEEWEDEEEE